jgi:hypothetical protein
MGSSYFLLLFFAGCSNPEPSRFINTATLEEIPVVHSVDVSSAKETRKRQIIHILNWHFVPRADFALDIRTEAEKAGVTLSDDDIDRNWESFLGEVEAVQKEQMAVLRNLAKSHGLNSMSRICQCWACYGHVRVMRSRLFCSSPMPKLASADVTNGTSLGGNRLIKRG